MELNFKIVHDRIQRDMKQTPPVSDSVNHITAVFEFDGAWDGFAKTALFGNGSSVYKVVLKDDRCVIPWEALAGTRMTVSVFGVKDDVRITATELNIPLARSGYKDGKLPDKPSDSAYTQLLKLLAWVVTSKEAITKFAEGSTDVPQMINWLRGDGSIVTLDDALQDVIMDINLKADKKNASGGFNGGLNANAANGGGAVGQGAYAYRGFAGGYGSTTGDGAAIGCNAKCNNGKQSIDAIQLGTGTNPNEKTVQAYGFTLMNADGTIPLERADKIMNEVDSKIAEAKSIIPKRYLVAELPTENIDTNGTYLVPAETPNENNIYTEYAYINGAWEIIGSPFEVDLSDYYTKSETYNMLEKKLDKDTTIVTADASQELFDLLSGACDWNRVLGPETMSRVSDVEHDILDKSDKTTITAETASSITMTHNTEYRYDEAAELTLTLPDTLPDDYISSVVFTSGDTATALTYPALIRMYGTDCSNGKFKPTFNKRYKITVSYDGYFLVGTVSGFSL